MITIAPVEKPGDCLKQDNPMNSCCASPVLPVQSTDDDLIPHSGHADLDLAGRPSLLGDLDE